MAALRSWSTCLGSPANERAYKTAVAGDGFEADVDGEVLVNACVFEGLFDVRSGGELPFGEAVDTVVFDDVDHRKIASEEMLELSKADRSGVTVATDGDGGEGSIGE